MLKAELLKQYKLNISNLRKCAKESNLSDEEITNIFTECFVKLEGKSGKSGLSFRRNSKFSKVLIIVILAAVLYILLNVHQATSSIVLRNVQGLIYPGLKLLRVLAVPVINWFPSLTSLYDESCLLENPYFHVSDMDCWPCEQINSVIDLTQYDNYSLYQSGTPYIVKLSQRPVSFGRLKDLYMQNRAVFTMEPSHFSSTNRSLLTLEQLFASNLEDSTHVSWRMNRMSPARLIRDLFLKPHVISEWSGQSIERFLLLDGKMAESYPLPNTECSYVALIQGAGERTIVLKPSSECTDRCKAVSVVLRESFLLWYNWWYWRPISLPSENSTGYSITYVTSFC